MPTLPVVVVHDKAGVQFFDVPGRREAAYRHYPLVIRKAWKDRIPLTWPAVRKLVEDFFHRLVNELLEADPLDRFVNSLIFANSPGNERALHSSFAGK